MRACAAIFVLGLLGASAASAQPAAAPAASASAPDPAVGKAVFLYGRAKYFHAVAVARRCGQVDRAQFDQANQRFEAARARLTAVLGERFTATDQQPAVPPGTCDPVTLNAYAMHVGELEQAVAAIPAP